MYGVIANKRGKEEALNNEIEEPYVSIMGWKNEITRVGV